MKKEQAIVVADKKNVETGEQHYVVWNPDNYKEVFMVSGYKVLSENEMTDEFGSVEDYAPHIVHASGF